MADRIRILLVDDHAMVRRGMRPAVAGIVARVMRDRSGSGSRGGSTGSAGPARGRGSARASLASLTGREREVLAVQHGLGPGR